MNDNIFTLKDIMDLVRPIVKKYGVKEIYLFGSYARGEAEGERDLDFLVFGEGNFKLTMIFAFAEELREVLKRMWIFLKFMRFTRTVILNKYMSCPVRVCE